LRHMPATGPLLGKLSLSVQHDQGWIFPRQIAEAVEAVEEVPLPARYGYWAVSGGIAVEVVTRGDELSVRRTLEKRLDEQGYRCVICIWCRTRGFCSILCHCEPIWESRGSLSQVMTTRRLPRPAPSPVRWKRSSRKEDNMQNLSFYVIVGSAACAM